MNGRLQGRPSRWAFLNCTGVVWFDMVRLVSNTGHVRTINASDFKARCLAILDRVQTTGERLVILKRGRPVAELLPASRTDAEYAQLELKGTVIEAGDIVKPAVPEEHWESLDS
ncbi:MAG: type II toxin-antitoxin system Phd/YefM family antitoxin [Bryobacterales bacterium]|nr:type II toxin-antitoxin system Phd/YefM family antitoxin [Bryobacterales bacterium]